MALHAFVFLLAVCLLLLARLGRFDWSLRRPSSSPDGAKHSRLHRLLKPRTPTIALPVDSPLLPRWVVGQYLLRCGTGAR